MTNKKETSKQVASKASRILRNPKSTADQRSVAASDLAQTRTGRKKSMSGQRMSSRRK